MVEGWKVEEEEVLPKELNEEEEGVEVSGGRKEQSNDICKRDEGQSLTEVCVVVERTEGVRRVTFKAREECGRRPGNCVGQGRGRDGRARNGVRVREEKGSVRAVQGVVGL